MKSKPPDLMCPIQVVSRASFSRYYLSIENGDRVFQPNRRDIAAIWHWRRGVWITSIELNVMFQAVWSVLKAMADSGAMESLHEFLRQSSDRI